jgi:hypothetical protein
MNPGSGFLDVTLETPRLPHFQGLVRATDNMCFDVASCGEQGHSTVRTQYTGCRSQGVRGEGISGDDRNQGLIGQAEAGARINDMGVALAIDLQVLKDIPGGGQRAVCQQDMLGRRRLRHIERRDFNPPTAAAGWWIAHGHVTAADDQGGFNTLLAQDADGFIDGISFGDAAEVQAHVGHQQFNRSGPWIQPHVTVADRRAGTIQSFGRRQRTVTSGSSPDVDVRSNRDVERAFRLLGECLCPVEDSPEVVADGDGPAFSRGPGQTAQLALGIVIGEDVVEFPNAGEGGERGFLGPGGRRCVKDHSEWHPHFRPAELMALELNNRRSRASCHEQGAEGEGEGQPGCRRGTWRRMRFHATTFTVRWKDSRAMRKANGNRVNVIGRVWRGSAIFRVGGTRGDYGQAQRSL